MPNGQKLPVTNDCSSYIVCEYNSQSVRTCPNGLLFDPIIQVCNWAAMVKCGQTPTVPEVWKPSTTSTVNIPSAPTPSYTTVRPIQTTTPPPTTTRTTTRTTRTTTTTTTRPPPTTTSPATTRATTITTSRVPESSPYPQCTSDGFYFIPHPSACESYYICAYGMLILHSCGQGVYWNSESNQCDFPERTNCSNLPNPAKPETSTPSIGTTTVSKLPNCRSTEIFHPSIEDCSKYYICIGSAPILMSCPSDYLWNSDISQCDRPEQAHCATSID
ncbi:probable chitinase 10 [Ochlerotatus camptorhynchus]|uniref:probable chitinase 10 n=1 Tax=Ochlerotatus camptorhynchus TaxID=644619 RepID=UPI0031CF321B